MKKNDLLMKEGELVRVLEVRERQEDPSRDCVLSRKVVFLLGI